MANEIVVLERRRGGHGEKDILKFLFLFPIVTPIQVNGANVVPTPAPDPASLEGLVMTAGERGGLDAGTMAYVVDDFAMAAGMSGAQVEARLQQIYTSRLADYQARYVERYQFLGNRFNAV